MKYEYKRVDIDTEKGLKDAELLQAAGWKVISCGCSMCLMERPKNETKIKKPVKTN